MSTLSASVTFPLPSTSRVLSPEVIASRVQQRVKERNEWTGTEPPTGMEIVKLAWNHFGDVMFPSIPSQEELDKVFPVLDVDMKRILNPPSDEIQVTWIGHASLLVQMNHCNLLTDPIFSKRCSPSQWFGPKRFRKPACQVQDLVTNEIPIHVVVISHNHYDHLDYASIKDLATKVGDITFVVPLGLKDWLSKNIPACEKIVELDWHESVRVVDDTIDVTSVPMRHWSSRTGDRDKTLWCGYSIASSSRRFLFPGDTAWFDGLKDIGQDYGPFDLAALPIGAYEPRDFMKNHHINPQEAVLMMEAVQAKKAVPIHWGTFPLTIEPVMEPIELLEEIMGDRKQVFGKWLIGETVVTCSDETT